MCDVMVVPNYDLYKIFLTHLITFPSLIVPSHLGSSWRPISHKFIYTMNTAWKIGSFNLAEKSVDSVHNKDRQNAKM